MTEEARKGFSWGHAAGIALGVLAVACHFGPLAVSGLAPYAPILSALLPMLVAGSVGLLGTLPSWLAKLAPVAVVLLWFVGVSLACSAAQVKTEEAVAGEVAGAVCSPALDMNVYVDFACIVGETAEGVLSVVHVPVSKAKAGAFAAAHASVDAGLSGALVAMPDGGIVLADVTLALPSLAH